MAIHSAVIVALVCVGVAYLIRQFFQSQPLAHGAVTPPGKHKLFGHLTATSGENPGQQQFDLIKRFGAGKWVNFYIFVFPRLSSADPGFARHVLVTNSSNYIKPVESLFTGYNELVPLLGQGLLLSEGESWKAHRKIANPAFAYKHLKNLINVFVDNTEIFLSNLDTMAVKKPVEIQAEITKLTVDVIGEAGFGFNFNSLKEENSPLPAKLFHVLSELQARISRPWHKFNWFASREFDKSLKYIRDMAQSAIDNKRREGIKDDDYSIMAFLMNASKNNAEGELTYNDESLIDEAITFMIAGHETSASTLTWTLHMLDTHPEAKQKLLEEINSVAPKGTYVTYDHVTQMHYLEACLKETLRLYPPITGVGRQALQDDQYENLFIPKGTQVSIVMWGIHRQESIWGPDANEFRPERWLEGKNLESGPDGIHYLPFAAGPRNCIGMTFALLEMKVILAMFMRQFDFEVTNRDAVKMQQSLTIRPRNGLYIQVTQRS